MRTNTLPDAVWHLLLASSFATFAAFLILDARPNLLLAGCSGATVAIFLWATLRMYRWNLLLSPVIFIALDPRQLPFYSWGNLGARAAGTGRYHANPGSLEFYPQVALLTLLGLVLFTAIVFGPLAKVTRLARVRYEDLVWKPWQPLAIGLAACSLLLYLSFALPIHGRLLPWSRKQRGPMAFGGSLFPSDLDDDQRGFGYAAAARKDRTTRRPHGHFS